MWISTKDNVNALACEPRLLNFAHAGESRTAGEEVRFKTIVGKRQYGSPGLVSGSHRQPHHRMLFISLLSSVCSKFS